MNVPATATSTNGNDAQASRDILGLDTTVFIAVIVALVLCFCGFLACAVAYFWVKKAKVYKIDCIF